MVLSSGGFTFTTDKRVRVRHDSASDWRLVIDPVDMERDGGLYECQVNTRPVKMSLVFKLNVMREYNYRAPIADPLSYPCLFASRVANERTELNMLLAQQ